MRNRCYDSKSKGLHFRSSHIYGATPLVLRCGSSKEFLKVASEPFYYNDEAKHPIESLEVLSERPTSVDN